MCIDLAVIRPQRLIPALLDSIGLHLYSLNIVQVSYFLMNFFHEILTAIFSVPINKLIVLFIPQLTPRTLCNHYTSGSTPPQGFGAAWNVAS